MKEKYIIIIGIVSVLSGYVLSNLYNIAPPGNREFALRLWNTGLMSLICVYSFSAYLFIDNKYILAKILWILIFAFEFISLLEYGYLKFIADDYSVQILNEQWGITISKSTAARINGLPSHFLIPGVLFSWIGIVFLRYYKTFYKNNSISKLSSEYLYSNSDYIFVFTKIPKSFSDFLKSLFFKITGSSNQIYCRSYIYKYSKRTSTCEKIFCSVEDLERKKHKFALVRTVAITPKKLLELEKTVGKKIKMPWRACHNTWRKVLN
jgi:hypothetical protein